MVVDNVNGPLSSESVGGAASGGMADVINQRTYVVDKLRKATERNTGP